MALPTTNIVFCGTAYGDHAQLEQCARLKRATPLWPVPKGARVGNRVLFYNTDREKAFVATGIIASPPESDGSGAHYHYHARIAQIRVLSLPLSVQDARHRFPSWKWLRYPRTRTTVPIEHERALLALVQGKESTPSAETGSRAKTFFGSKSYQIRAKTALPLLVGLAKARDRIYYEEFAKQLGISNPRVLGYVLGSVGQTLCALGRRWGEKIPPIESLVINQRQELPGEGVGFFLDEGDYRKMPIAEKRRRVDKLHRRIWNYSRWDDVLDALGVEPAPPAQIKSTLKKGRLQGGGFGNPETNKLVETAAIGAAKRWLKRRGYRVRSREYERIGYDLDAVRHDSTLHVEVKGVSGFLTEFVITRNEVEKARSDPLFRLFVVTRALHPQPETHFYSGTQLLEEFDLQPIAYRAVPK